MSFNPLSFFRFALWMVLWLSVWGFGAPAVYAQVARPNIDSMRRANAARMDSMRAAREAATKIFKETQQRRTDSLAALRKYRESKRYTDSVARIRQARTDSSRAVQKTRTDSLTAARNKARDSLTSARNVVMTEMRATQKKRSDSLNARKAYRESKRYADSVEVVRKVKADSLQAARKAFADRTKAERTAIASALTAARKKTADSLKAIRKKTSDSLMAFRKQRSDSVAAVRALKDKAAKDKEKAKDKKMEFALNLKISKKREKWSNESMLRKRWGPPRKQLQNLFTHYNYYYNANRKMEMAEENMLRVKKDIFDKPIDLFPFNPDTDSSLLLADMDSIVQKTSVGIQIHDPRTDWADELYLLLGQAYYYKGSYDNAAIAFRYIISLRELKKKEQARNSGVSTRGKTPSILQNEKKSALDFLKHQSVHNDALLWLSRTFAQTGRYGEAESVLDLLINDPNFPPSLKGRYSVEAANLAIKTRKFKEAPTHLLAVAEDKSMASWQRQRASFLAGQLLYEEGKYPEAAAAFAKTIDLNPKIDMDFQARKNRAYAVMASGVASEETIAALRKMLKDNKYAPYYEQIYYVLGKIYANSGDRPMAIQYLNQSLRASKTTKAQKALSFLALGDVYYADGQYNPAQISYDSAAYLAGRDAVAKAPFDVAAQRAKSLAAVAGPARMVAAQDSLLALSNLSEKEQRAVVKKYLKSLAARKSDSASRAALANDNSVMALPTADGNDMSGNSNNDWYFASATTMQQGQADFRRKWGNRPLVDNWRRAAAVATASSTAAGGNIAGQSSGASSGDTTTTDTEVASDGPTETSLMAQIPRTDAARDAVREQLQKSMLTLAGAYAKDVQDYPRAMKVLDDVDRRFPEPKYPDESLYLGYLIYLRQNQIERAQMLAQQLLEKYPNSSYASLVRPADDDAGPLMTGSVEASSYYEETYNLVQKRSYTEALRRSRDGQKRWTDPRINERFRMLEIMALSGNSEYNKADSLAGKFISTTGNDSLRTWAQTVQDFIRANKPRDTVRPTASISPTPGTTSTGTLPTTNPTTPTRPADSAATRLTIPTATTPTPIPATYTYSAAAPHVFAFVFNRMEAKVMGVKAGLGDMNTLQYSGQGLQTQIQNLPDGKGLIVVKGFSNAQKAKAYEQNFKATPVLTREFRAGEVKTFLISEDNLRKLAADGDLAAYEAFYRRSYR